jgi:hypothetical protein
VVIGTDCLGSCKSKYRDKAYQLLAHGRWFSPGTPTSSTIKSGCHDIVEILLKVALNTNALVFLSGGESAQLSLIVGYICIVDEIPKVGYN